MKNTTKQSFLLLSVFLIVIAFPLTSVQAATKTLNYDTATGTLYDIVISIDSTKVIDGNNTFFGMIRITDLSADTISIHHIQFFYRLGNYFEDNEMTIDTLTADGMASTAELTFEYNSTWGNVDLEVLIKFQEEVNDNGGVVTHYYETNWISIFTLKPSSGASWSAISAIAATILLGSLWYNRTKRK